MLRLQALLEPSPASRMQHQLGCICCSCTTRSWGEMETTTPTTPTTTTNSPPFFPSFHAPHTFFPLLHSPPHPILFPPSPTAPFSSAIPLTNSRSMYLSLIMSFCCHCLLYLMSLSFRVPVCQCPSVSLVFCQNLRLSVYKSHHHRLQGPSPCLTPWLSQVSVSLSLSRLPLSLFLTVSPCFSISVLA